MADAPRAPGVADAPTMATDLGLSRRSMARALYCGRKRVSVLTTNPSALFAFIVHVGMAVFPMISVGAIRKGKRKPGPARMMAVLLSVIGSLYLLVTFGLLMNPSAVRGFFT